VALDVLLVPANHKPGAPGGEVIADLHWDGYFEFLSDFWPASSTNGKTIDLYDTAIYCGSNLAQLRSCLEGARVRAESRERSFEVQIGEQTHPLREKLMAKVDRAELLALIDRLLAAADRAVREEKAIHFLGD
jgi:hypothetical protein